MPPTANYHPSLSLILLIVLAAFFAGCADERVVQVTREADNRQAQQNDQIARVVNEETAFRQESAKLHRDLRSDQAAIAQQRDQLEAERKQIASQRQWAEFYTPLLETVGIVAVIIAVLVYCGLLLRTLANNGPADAILAESLAAQILPVESLPPPAPWSEPESELPSPRITGQLCNGKRLPPPY